MLANGNCHDVEVLYRKGFPVFNPANHSDQVGMVIEASPSDVEAALSAAEAFAPQWQATAPELSRIPA